MERVAEKSQLEMVEEFRNHIKEYKQNVERLDANITNPKYSKQRKKGFKALKKICLEEISDLELKISQILENGGIVEPLDDGADIAKWQKKVHEGEKTLPFREWKKKYGDKFRKV